MARMRAEVVELLLVSLERNGHEAVDGDRRLRRAPQLEDCEIAPISGHEHHCQHYNRALQPTHQPTHHLDSVLLNQSIRFALHKQGIRSKRLFNNGCCLKAPFVSWANRNSFRALSPILRDLAGLGTTVAHLSGNQSGSASLARRASCQALATASVGELTGQLACQPAEAGATGLRRGGGGRGLGLDRTQLGQSFFDHRP
jgi:hypothetical protein